ncbi:hypothetical protein C0J52_00523, partial [Blattella germanica]
ALDVNDKTVSLISASDLDTLHANDYHCLFITTIEGWGRIYEILWRQHRFCSMCLPWLWTITLHRSFHFSRPLLRQAVEISCQVSLQTFHKPSIVLGLLEERPLFNRPK